MELMKLSKKQIKDEIINTVSCRELHCYLECTERFNSWFNRQLEYGFIYGVDYIGCKEFNTLANQELDNYYITLDMAKEISMVQRTDKGKQARQYFIDCERKLKTIKTPQTYLEALKELVVITEEKERLQSLNNALMHVVKTYTTGEIAKELNYKSASQLNKLLHNKGIQYKQNGTWLLYSKYADMGLVEIKQGVKHDHTYYNQQWTQKGRQFILALFDAV
jgi:anti-repressor protein